MKTRLTQSTFLTALALSVLGCGPSTYEVSQRVKSSMQDSFDADTRFSSLHLKVVSVTLVKSHGNSYDGIATLRSDFKNRDIGITASADGDNTIWRTEPGALLVLSADAIQQTDAATTSRSSSSVELSDQKEIEVGRDYASDAKRIVREDFEPNPEYPLDLRHGTWTAVVVDRSQDFVTAKVHYSLSIGINCDWFVRVSAPATYSVSGSDDCTKGLFHATAVGSPRVDHFQ